MFFRSMIYLKKSLRNKHLIFLTKLVQYNRIRDIILNKIDIFYSILIAIFFKNKTVSIHALHKFANENKKKVITI